MLENAAHLLRDMGWLFGPRVSVPQGMKKQEKEQVMREFRETGGSNPEREMLDDSSAHGSTPTSQGRSASGGNGSRNVGKDLGKEIEKKFQGAVTDVRGVLDRFLR